VRCLVAWFPDWPLVAAGIPPDVAAVVLHANRVVAATPAARAEGIREGLRRREAQARCPAVRVVEEDRGRDARAWEPAVAAVESLAPAVEVATAGELLLGTRGPSRYFGGDAALAELICRTVDEAAGQEGCRVGVGDGRFTAGLAARAGARAAQRVVVVGRGESRRWLAPQPVNCLGPGYEDLADLLVRFGIRTLGELGELPASAVLGRFGAMGDTARRLARGLDERPVVARTPPPGMSVPAELDPPLDRVEAAAFVAKSLADELLYRLEREGLAATMVAIEAQTEHGESLVRHWRHDGALTAAALAERARWQLDGWIGVERGGSPTAGITLLRLTAEEVRPDDGKQLGFWGGVAESDEQAARAFARVQGLLGPDGVVTAVLGGGRGFAEQVRLVPWGDCREPPPDTDARRRRVLRGPSAEAPPWPGRVGGPAPAVVFGSGTEAEVLGPDGLPVEVDGRGLLSSAPSSVAIAGGARRQVSGWAGPWPIEERWWDRGGRRRARLQVLLEDGGAYLLSRERGCWTVEGSYC